MAGARFVYQEALQAPLLVAAAQSPDRGPVTLEAVGDGLDGLTGSDGQEDTGMLDLKERQVPAARRGLEDGDITGSDRYRTRLSATHWGLLLCLSRGLSPA